CPKASTADGGQKQSHAAPPSRRLAVGVPLTSGRAARRGPASSSDPEGPGTETVRWGVEACSLRPLHVSAGARLAKAQAAGRGGDPAREGGTGGAGSWPRPRGAWRGDTGVGVRD
ncbi:unnamed protein product, partial [Urochloa humidicola]